MRKILKWLILIVVVPAIVALILAAFNYEKLVRLYHVNTLFSEENIIDNFSGMKDLFYWAPIGNTGEAVAWEEEPKPVTRTYRFGGKTLDVEQWLTNTRTTSLLVIHQGKIVHEEYRLGTTRKDRRISWSMAKSFLSAAFGIALEAGKIRSLDDKVTDYVASLAGSTYDGITIRNVLNMASGVKFDEDYLDFNSDINRMGRILATGGSMDEFAATLEGREREQGILRQYTSIDTHVLAMVLRAATEKSLIELVGENLVSKLGMEGEAYYLTDGFGVAFALGGINMISRDYARFGQMILDYGVWRGAQIVPREWIIQSTRVSAPKPVDPDDPFGYGYQWWIPENGQDEFFAVGIYGQFIYINRPARIVIIKTSAHRGFRDDGRKGIMIKQETNAMFRAMAADLSGWVSPLE